MAEQKTSLKSKSLKFPKALSLNPKFYRRLKASGFLGLKFREYDLNMFTVPMLRIYGLGFMVSGNERKGLDRKKSKPKPYRALTETLSPFRALTKPYTLNLKSKPKHTSPDRTPVRAPKKRNHNAPKGSFKSSLVGSFRGSFMGSLME